MDYLILIIAVLLIFLDLKNILTVDSKLMAMIGLIVMPHTVLLIYCLTAWQFYVTIGVLTIFLFVRYQIIPKYYKHTNVRLMVLIGGRWLLLASLYSIIAQTIFYIIYFRNGLIQLPTAVWLSDLVITCIWVFTLYVNGFIRVVATSRRLNIWKRIGMFLLLFIPPINLVIIIYLAHESKIECITEADRLSRNNVRKESSVCQTKYPLLLLHGVGFRDRKYFNYWGRIPKELMSNGATVYYGQQEGWGSIEENGEQIKQRILEIIAIEECEKVNIIAHSKGGLDARYVISALNMDDYVASLTTLSTPNHGSKVVDMVYKLPDKVLLFVAGCINRYFKLIGDKDPDCLTVSEVFSEEYSQKFNEKIINSPKVYYQSYASIMKWCFSDYILTIPYLLLYIKEGKNDGLVSIESAKWGTFKGVFKSESLRGVSHGDTIDLRRNDYRGFDIREIFVNLVSELKEIGF